MSVVQAVPQRVFDLKDLHYAAEAHNGVGLGAIVGLTAGECAGVGFAKKSLHCIVYHQKQ